MDFIQPKKIEYISSVKQLNPDRVYSKLHEIFINNWTVSKKDNNYIILAYQM